MTVLSFDDGALQREEAGHLGLVAAIHKGIVVSQLHLDVDTLAMFSNYCRRSLFSRRTLILIAWICSFAPAWDLSVDDCLGW